MFTPPELEFSPKRSPSKELPNSKVHPFLHAEKLTGKKRAKPTNLLEAASHQPRGVWIHEKSFTSKVVCAVRDSAI